ncbi:hypothetical protein ACFVZA_38235 [Streptomyces bottropensis]
MTWPIDQYQPRPPIIILSGTPLQPREPAATPVGAQVVVLSGKAPLSEGGVRLNRYYSLAKEKSWYKTYGELWHQIAQDVAQHRTPGDILLLVTFGLDSNMPPTDEAVRQLRTAGSGRVLSDWINHCNPGSQVGNPYSWVDRPCVYAFAGVFGVDTDRAVEVYRPAKDSVEVDLNVYLYREAFGGQYTVALG